MSHLHIDLLVQAEPDEIQGLFHSVGSLLLVHVVHHLSNPWIDAFELWCWRRLLRVLCIAKRSNQPILKEINPEYSLEGLMLKLQYFGHLMQRANSLEKTLMLGKIEGKRRRERQRMRWLDGITSALDMNLSKLWEWRSEEPGVLQFMRWQRVQRLDNNKQWLVVCVHVWVNF